MNAEFILSAAKPEQFIKTDLPEICFAGRSNVGKSSMINKILGRKNLVKVGNTPGKTRLINFFNIDSKYIFTDLPGYGYAAVSKAERAAWGKLIEYYFAYRQNLALCVLLLDIRRIPNNDDMKMIAAMNSRNVPLISVLTKADKLSNNEKVKQIKIISESSGIDKENLIVFSSVTGQGKEQVWQEIVKTNISL